MISLVSLNNQNQGSLGKFLHFLRRVVVFTDIFPVHRKVSISEFRVAVLNCCYISVDRGQTPVDVQRKEVLLHLFV
jgi:hypothetical protein